MQTPTPVDYEEPLHELLGCQPEEVESRIANSRLSSLELGFVTRHFGIKRKAETLAEISGEGIGWTLPTVFATIQTAVTKLKVYSQPNVLPPAPRRRRLRKYCASEPGPSLALQRPKR